MRTRRRTASEMASEWLESQVNHCHDPRDEECPTAPREQCQLSPFKLSFLAREAQLCASSTVMSDGVGTKPGTGQSEPHSFDSTAVIHATLMHRK